MEEYTYAVIVPYAIKLNAIDHMKEIENHGFCAYIIKIKDSEYNELVRKYREDD